MKMFEPIFEKYERIRNDDQGDKLHRKFIDQNLGDSNRKTTPEYVEIACRLGGRLEDLARTCSKLFREEETYSGMSLEEFDNEVFTYLDPFWYLPLESQKLIRESRGFKGPLQRVNRYRKWWYDRNSS